MRFPVTPRNTVLRDLREQLRAQYSGGRVIVGVDGLTGTRAFAADLADIIGEFGDAVYQASILDFVRPASERPGPTPAPGWIDTDTFRRVLIDPFRSGVLTASTTGFQLRMWDAATDSPVPAKWVTGPENAVLLVDGPFLQSEFLGGLWHWSTWLRTAEEQLALRPGRSAEEPFTAPEFQYLRSSPERRANVLVDVTDPTLPFEYFQDSC